MDNLVALIILVLIPIFFGYRYVTEFHEPFSRQNWQFHNWLAALFYVGYLTLFFVHEKHGLYALSTYITESRKFFTFFVLPSIGFGLALFPKVASEFTKDHFKLVQVGIVNFAAFWGWLIVLYLLLIIIIP